MSTARYLVGDVFDVLATLEPGSVDLVFSSPPFLALRSYLPADHPEKAKEIGSEATPADFLDTLLDVVEACDRVLAPHGSLCFELGDTFSGSGGAGGDYNEGGLRDGQQAFSGSAAKRARLGIGDDYRPSRAGRQKYAENTRRGKVVDHDSGRRTPGPGWPDAKSLCLIPTLFAASLAYGYNMLRPERTTPRWRIRNLVVWARPNPPVGALGDKFRPATSYVTVATKSARRYFDLDAVRGPYSKNTNARVAKGVEAQERTGKSADRDGNWNSLPERDNDGAGAPPLDYWVIPTHPYPGSHYATFPPELVVKPVKAMCPAFVCLDCGAALGLEREAPRTVLPGMRQTADQQMEDGGDEVLLEAVCEPAYSSQPGEHEGLHPRPQGLHPGPGSGASDGEPRGLRHGAPLSDGAEARADAGPGRCGPSSERREGRQPPGELGAADESDARPLAEDTEANRVSTLRARRSAHGERTSCGRCGSESLRPGRTLDPFAGSGTTLAVATGHGRDAIGIDLDARNADLATARVGPMFLTVEHLSTEGAA